MTNQEKIAYLKQYRYAVRREERLKMEIDAWRSRAERTTVSMTGLPSGGRNTNAPFVCSAEQVDKLLQMLESQHADTAALRWCIGAAIAGVPNDKLREVLELRYIGGHTWEQIAVTLNISYQWVCALHGKSLELIEVDTPPML